MPETKNRSADIAARTVDVYCHSHCIGGEGALSWLREAKIPFTVHDIGRDPEARRVWRSLGGQPSPVLVVNGQVLVGFDDGEVARLLGKDA